MTIATITLISGTTQSNAPFSLGQAFRQGDVPSGSNVVAPFADFQCKAKNAWPDGSLKFAVLSGRAALTGGVPLAMALSIGTPTAGTALTTADLKATGVVASIGCGAFGTVSWATTDWDSPFQAWISGPKMSSWVYRKAVGSDAQLVGWLEVRLWSGGEVEVLPWIENGYLQMPGSSISATPTSKSATYTFTLGGTSRASIAIDLPARTRTPLINGAALGYWLATDPQVTPSHDKDYLQATLLVPSYRGNVASPTLQTTYVPKAQGGFNYDSDYMPGVGFQEAIGLLPTHDVRYLTSTATGGFASVVRNGYSAGRYPIHFRDEATNRPLAFSAHPHASNNASSTGDMSATSTGTTAPGWDVAHHPSVGYAAYLATGAFYHMETVQFAATYNYLNQVDVPRQNDKGIFLSSAGASTTRGAAWSNRTLLHAATATPDADVLRSEFIASLTANIEFNHSTYVGQANNPFGIVAPYGDAYGTSSDGKVTEAIWQQDFYTAAYGYMLAADPPITSLTKTHLAAFFAWKAKSIIGRLGGTGSTEWLYRDAARYNIVVANVDFPDWAGGTGPWMSGWGALYQATYGVANPGVAGDLQGGNFPFATSYWGNIQPAISYAVQHNVPGAQAAYDRMTGAASWNSFAAGFNTDPVWGVEPGPSSTSGTTMPIATIPMGTMSMLSVGVVMDSNRTFGRLAGEIPTGFAQPHPLANDVDVSDPAGTRYAYEVTTVPAGLTSFSIQQNGGIIATGTDGAHVGVQTTKKSGVRTTGVPLTITFGAVTSTVTGVTVTPATITANTQLTGTVAGTGTISQAVTWTATGGATVSSSGLPTLPAATNSVQSGQIIATSVQDGSHSGFATWSVAAIGAPDTTGPTMFGPISVTATPSSIRITWPAATDPSGIGEYFTSINGGDPVSTGLEREAFYPSLDSSTGYDFEVLATDTLGNPTGTPLTLTVSTAAPVIVGNGQTASAATIMRDDPINLVAALSAAPINCTVSL